MDALPGIGETKPLGYAWRGDDPREQHRADGGIGRRVDRLQRQRNYAGDHDPRIRSGDHPGHAGGCARRPAGHPDDDPVAPRPHRAAARRPRVPEGAACAEEASHSGAKAIFTDFGIGTIIGGVDSKVLCCWRWDITSTE